MRRVRFLFLVTALLSLPWRVLATPGETFYVRSNNVNVRTAPSLHAAVLMQVHYGHVVIEIQRRAPWVHVSVSQTSGKTGWIHASLLRVVPPAPASK